MILSFSYSSTANAALSATTAQVINGTAPYLTFNGGTTKATDTSELLGITLSDGTTYTKTNNPSTTSNPLELPVAGQTVADIGMLVPATASPVSATDPTQKVNLSTLIGAPNNYWGDDDGDGQGVGGITATGTLSVAITDSSGNKVKRSDPLTACTAYYQIVLTSTSGNLTTQYGTPNETPFYGDSATYYIKPKPPITPYVCNAKPNLNWENGSDASSQWEVGKGFKLQSLGSPSSNFPTTGSNNLTFELTIAGATAQSVIDTVGATVQGTPSTSVSLALSASSANVLKVTLQGPRDGATALQANFSPTTFSLKSGATEIYNFRIGKWFITKPGVKVGSQPYCNNLGYRVPLRADYTNSPYASATTYPSQPTASTGLWAYPGTNNRDKRIIGGGLFAEWGYTTNAQTPYSSSDWENSIYWASEAWSSSTQYVVSSNIGMVSYYSPSDTNGYLRAACVMP